jgi:hypothetical protein
MITENIRVSRLEVLPPLTKIAAITNRNNTTPRQATSSTPHTQTTRSILSHSKSSVHSEVARQQTSPRLLIAAFTVALISIIKSLEIKNQLNRKIKASAQEA